MSPHRHPDHRDTGAGESQTHAQELAGTQRVNGAHEHQMQALRTQPYGITCGYPKTVDRMHQCPTPRASSDRVHLDRTHAIGRRRHQVIGFSGARDAPVGSKHLDSGRRFGNPEIDAGPSDRVGTSLANGRYRSIDRPPRDQAAEQEAQAKAGDQGAHVYMLPAEGPREFAANERRGKMAPQATPRINQEHVKGVLDLAAALGCRGKGRTERLANRLQVIGIRNPDPQKCRMEVGNV